MFDIQWETESTGQMSDVRRDRPSRPDGRPTYGETGRTSDVRRDDRTDVRRTARQTESTGWMSDVRRQTESTGQDLKLKNTDNYNVSHKNSPLKLSLVTLKILNRNHWKLQKTHWHPFEHCVLNCKWVQFQDRDIIICFQRHTKNAMFHNDTISVKSNEQSAKQSRLQMCSICPPSAFTHSQSSTPLLTMLFW